MVCHLNKTYKFKKSEIKQKRVKLIWKQLPITLNYNLKQTYYLRVLWNPLVSPQTKQNTYQQQHQHQNFYSSPLTNALPKAESLRYYNNQNSGKNFSENENDDKWRPSAELDKENNQRRRLGLSQIANFIIQKQSFLCSSVAYITNSNFLSTHSGSTVK